MSSERQPSVCYYETVRARRRSTRASKRASVVEYARARASPIINRRLVLDLIERVVVGRHTRVVDLFETNDDRVAHAGLVDGDDLAVVVEPVRLRAQNLNLRRDDKATRAHHTHVSHAFDGRIHRQPHGSTTSSSQRRATSRRAIARAPVRRLPHRSIESRPTNTPWSLSADQFGAWPPPAPASARAHENEAHRRQSLVSTYPSRRVATKSSRARIDVGRVSTRRIIINHRRTSASARTTARDARVVFVVLRARKNNNNIHRQSPRARRTRDGRAIRPRSRSTDRPIRPREGTDTLSATRADGATDRSRRRLRRAIVDARDDDDDDAREKKRRRRHALDGERGAGGHRVREHGGWRRSSRCVAVDR